MYDEWSGDGRDSVYDRRPLRVQHPQLIERAGLGDQGWDAAATVGYQGGVAVDRGRGSLGDVPPDRAVNSTTPRLRLTAIVVRLAIGHSPFGSEPYSESARLGGELTCDCPSEMSQRSCGLVEMLLESTLADSHAC